MKKNLAIGNLVYWQWGKIKLSGTIKKIHHQAFVKMIKGKKIHRNGTKENPAYLIQRENKNIVLKLYSELLENN